MTAEKALNIIAGLCSKKEYCSGDIRGKLLKWELPENDIRKIMEFLQSHKFIDDARFARIYAEDKFRFNHWGKKKIALMLSQKHISPNVITEALEAVDPEHYEESCLEILRQKMKSLQGLDSFQLKVRLMRFGLGRGFDYDTLNQCLSVLLRENDNQNFRCMG